MRTVTLLFLLAAGCGKHDADLFVDNRGPIELDVWVDGARWRTVAPNVDDKTPPSRPIGRGHHVLGTSKGAAPAPTATVAIDVDGPGAQLFNPGRTSCYTTDAPLAPREVYSLGKVDTWFVAKEGPRNVERNAPCDALASKGCAPAILEELVRCQSTSADPATRVACADRAKDACAFSKR